MNKTFKKMLSLVMILMMVVSTMVIMPLTTSAEGVVGDGSAATPYQASNYGELVAVNEAMAAAYTEGDTVYVALTGDIAVADADFTMPTEYVIQLNGNGNTISNLQKMLFASLPGGTIENLTVSNSAIVSDTAAHLSVFVGTGKGALTFNNVILTESVTITQTGSGKFSTGGFVGDANYAVTISNCVTSATISCETQRAGGFIGKSVTDEVSTVTISNSAVHGSVVSSYSGYVGGFAGQLAKTCNHSFINCINTASVSTSNNRAGGFVGITYATNIALTNCINEGTISGKSTQVGAFNGSSSGTWDLKNCISTVKDSYTGSASTSAVTEENVFYATAAADEANKDAVKAIYTAVYTGNNEALSARIKLKGGYGFKLFAQLPAHAMAQATAYGLIVNGDKVAVTNENGKLCYTKNDALVSDLNENYSVAVYVEIDGVEYTSVVRENVFNPYTLVSSMAVDGKYNGNVVTTDEAEIALYAAMVAYYEDYQAWIAEQN